MPPLPGTAIVFRVLTDRYPTETSWELRRGSSAGERVAWGGPLSEQSTAIVTELQLDDGRYALSVHDSAGDGICCSYGQGQYLMFLADQPGTIIASGGDFPRRGSLYLVWVSSCC